MKNTGHRNRKRRQMFRRIVALIIVVTLVTGLLPMPFVSEDGVTIEFLDLSPDKSVRAAVSGDLTSADAILAYAEAYSNDPASYQFDTIILDFTDTETVPSSFIGIGTESYPFSGTIQIVNVSGDNGGVSTLLNLEAPLFNYISDTVRITDVSGNDCTLYLSPAVLGGGETFTNALFANHVVGQGNIAANSANKVKWKLRVNNANPRSTIIGDMISGSTHEPYVDLTLYNQSATINGTSDIGLVCNTMSAGELYLTLLNGAEATSITTSSGNAGGLVGTISNGASLTVNSNITYASARNISTSDGYAGGIAGECEGTVSFGNNTYSDALEGTAISGTVGAGGLYGYYETESDVTFDLDKITVTTAQDSSAPGEGIKATAAQSNVGGLIGKLVNKGTSATPATVTVSGTSFSSSSPAMNVTLSAKSNYSNGGGLIGLYSADDLKDSLIIENVYIKSGGVSIKQYYGGVIGVVSSLNDCGAYVKIKDVKTDCKFNFGVAIYEMNVRSAGLICHSSNSFIDICGNIEPNGLVQAALLYAVTSGVIRLSGTTDLTKVADSKLEGLVVEHRGNTLIYAQGDGNTSSTWLYKRPATKNFDDAGTWGQIVRLVDGYAIDDASSGIATWDSSAHTLTLSSAVTAISSATDFTKTALNIQLNTSGSGFGTLQFTDSTTSLSSTLLSANITLTENVSLNGTGIIGFTRDNANKDAVSNVNPAIPAIAGSGNFTGTFKPTGGNRTLTLAIGEAYGYKGGSLASTGTNVTGSSLVSGNSMTGAIAYHMYSGLFAHLGACTIGDETYSLTIDGSITRCEGESHHIGGIGAELVGSPVIINKVITSEAINSYSGNGKQTIGFLIGHVPNSDAASLTINNCASNGTANVISNNASIGFIGTIDDANLSTSVNTMTIGSTINYSASGRPYSGGLIGLTSNLTSYGRNITLSNVTIDNESVNTNITGSSTAKYSNPAGGLLGGRWLSSNVYFGTSSVTGVTVTSGSLSLSGDATCAGGLVADAAGYWQVNKIGITAMSVSGATDALGLLVYRGCIDVSNTKYGLYLEFPSVTSTSYSITPTSVTNDSPTIYDEIVACSNYVSSTGELIEKNGQGIVSIKTTEISGVPKLSMTSGSDNSYQPRTTLGNNHNPNTRYYYNLDYLLKKASTSDSTAGEKMLLWSVYKYATSNISNNTAIKTANTNGFSYCNKLSGSGGIFTGDATTCDLSYLSYYPVDISEAVELSNVTVILHNQEMQSAHGSIYSLNGTRTGQSVNSQHYLMHAALFKNVSANLTISDMTLQGSVSSHSGSASVSAGSGAIVCGTISGASADSKQLTRISNLTLGGIKVNGMGNATDALLVTGIGSNVDFRISGVKTTALYKSGTSTVTAADYLLGEAEGSAMVLNFSDMVLDGRTTSSALYDTSAASGNAYNLNTAYNTYQSIFAKATFLKSLKYISGSGSSASYDYAYAADWGTPKHQVTYGKEIVDSTENADLQNKYVDRYGDYYTSPDSAIESESEYSDFSTYRPHVFVAYNASTDNHEVAVNIVEQNLTKGCGTYNDPYVVDGDQLAVVAKVLNSTVSTGFYLYIDKEYTGNDNPDRWCDGKSTNGHYQWKYNGTTFYRVDNSSKTLSLANVQKYLAGAYYEIDEDTSLGNSFQGLGGNSQANAFRGVIVGKKKNDVYPVITNASANPLVKISNGCVVKDVSVKVTAESISLSTDNYGSAGKYGYGLDNTPYYGAVIGEILAGDNIIDNVQVSYKNNNNSTFINVDGDGDSDADSAADSEKNIAVGAYVGVIVNGSLFFRNMSKTVGNTTTVFTDQSVTGFHVYKASDTTKTTPLEGDISYVSDKSETLTNLYINPIIGRVINGVAINETDAYRYSEDGNYVDQNALERTASRATDTNKVTLKNGRKNYSIPDFNKSLDAAANATAISNGDDAVILYFSGNNYTDISVPDAQALYVLSAITQINAGSATINTSGDDAYQTGKITGYKNNYATVHLAQYSDVGTNNTGDFDIAKKDKYNLTTLIPYIIYKYTNSYETTISSKQYIKYPARRITNGSSYSISLTGNSTYYLPDCFRGIGFLGGANSSGFYCENNDDTKMKLSDFNGNDNTIDVNIYFRNYVKSLDNYYNVANDSGMGLFNRVELSGITVENGIPTNSLGFRNFTLQGYISAKRISSTNTVSIGNSSDYWRVGGVLPYSTTGSSFSFDSISFNSLNLDGTFNTGALIGKTYSDGKVVCVNNCNADKLKLSGTSSIGALIGDPAQANVYINVKTGASGEYKICVHQLPLSSDAKVALYSGGLVGYKSKNNLLVKNVDIVGWNASFDASSTKKPYIGRDIYGGGESVPNGNGDNKPEGMYSGGIVGMLSGGNTSIENVNVYGVNINGYASGGILGSAYADGSNCYFSNCGVHGSSDDSITIKNDTYTIQGIFASGGVSGYFHNPCNKEGEEKGLNTMSICGKTYTAGCIENAYVHDYTMKETSTDANEAACGGLIGVMRNRKMLCNVKIEGCTFLCNSSGATKEGGIVGCTTKYNIYGYNICVKDNTFSQTGNNNKVQYGIVIGGAYKGVPDGGNRPNQIMISGLTSSGNKVTSTYGTLFSGERNVEFVYGRPNSITEANGLYLNSFNSTFATTYLETGKQGTYNPGSYIIYSDYKSFCNGNSKGESVSTVNNTGNVTMPNGCFPYSVTSPSKALGDKILTGDGIWVNVSEENDEKIITIMADEIIKDRKAATTTYDADVYKNFSDTDMKIYEKLKADGKISTYNTQAGSNILPNDIPVLVMDDNAYTFKVDGVSYNYTDAIQAYLRILTNSSWQFNGSTTNKENQVYSMDLLKCTFTNGSLTYTSDGCTVSRNALGQFSMNMNNGYDSSTTGQFTLLDVKFYDPFSYDSSSTCRTKYAYHLYVPIFTKRMFPFKFSITALSGTSYYPLSYTGGTHYSDIENKRGNDPANIVVEDYGTPVTMYLRYEYDVEDIIDDILSGGYGLDWNYNKALDYIYIYPTNHTLPSNTKFVLVDKNKNEKVNYSNGFSALENADLEIDGTVFPAYSFDDGSGSAYSVVTFAELLTAQGITFTASTLAAGDVETTTVPIFHTVLTDSNDTSQFTASGVPSGYSLVPASDEDKTAGTDLYTVSASGGTSIIEDYYLTVYAPADSGNVRHQITVKSVDNLNSSGKMMASCEGYNDKLTLVFANLFNKSVTVKTIEADGTDKLMGSGGGDTVTVQAVSTISFNSEGLGTQLGEVITQLNTKSIPIYHSTQLYLKKTESDNTQQTVAVNGTTFTPVLASSGNEDNYLFNSGVYVTMSSDYTGSDCYYSYGAQDTITGYYKQMVACNPHDSSVPGDVADISGDRITNFYEVINTNNGTPIDLRPYLTGEDSGLIAGGHEVKVVSNFIMSYTSAGIEKQFPVREGDNVLAGTEVFAKAALAYRPEGTTYSNNTSSLVEDIQTRKYYRNPSTRTTLAYNVILDDLLTSSNAQIKTNDMLGVNPLDETTDTLMSIHTFGDYGATQLVGASGCTQVKWTLSLYRREPIAPNGQYGTKLPIENYLTNIKVYGIDSKGDKDESNEISLTSGSGTTMLTYQAARDNFEDITVRVNPEDTTELTNKFMVYVDYDVKTGSLLETPEYFYSNYKVVLTGELVGDPSSVASDHIIYTNARLDPTFIDMSGSEP